MNKYKLIHLFVTTFDFRTWNYDIDSLIKIKVVQKFCTIQNNINKDLSYLDSKFETAKIRIQITKTHCRKTNTGAKINYGMTT